jgi:hypothetical protein
MILFAMSDIPDRQALIIARRMDVNGAKYLMKNVMVTPLSQNTKSRLTLQSQHSKRQ